MKTFSFLFFEEIGVANELVELGIPKQDIILAYHAPFMRQDDEFGLG